MDFSNRAIGQIALLVKKDASVNAEMLRTAVEKAFGEHKNPNPAILQKKNRSRQDTRSAVTVAADDVESSAPVKRRLTGEAVDIDSACSHANTVAMAQTHIHGLTPMAHDNVMAPGAEVHTATSASASSNGTAAGNSEAVNVSKAAMDTAPAHCKRGAEALVADKLSPLSLASVGIACDKDGSIPPGTAPHGYGLGCVKTCSDKIAKWNVLGLQGGLLSHYLQPIFMQSLTVGRKFSEIHCRRALCCRLEKKKRKSAKKSEALTSRSDNPTTDPCYGSVHHPRYLCTGIKLDKSIMTIEDGAVFSTQCFVWGSCVNARACNRETTSPPTLPRECVDSVSQLKTNGSCDRGGACSDDQHASVVSDSNSAAREDTTVGYAKSIPNHSLTCRCEGEYLKAATGFAVSKADAMAIGVVHAEESPVLKDAQTSIEGTKDSTENMNFKPKLSTQVGTCLSMPPTSAGHIKDIAGVQIEPASVGTLGGGDTVEHDSSCTESDRPVPVEETEQWRSQFATQSLWQRFVSIESGPAKSSLVDNQIDNAQLTEAIQSTDDSNTVDDDCKEKVDPGETMLTRYRIRKCKRSRTTGYELTKDILFNDPRSCFVGWREDRREL
ncbi:hypothetical protein, variant [Sphaeroforma arctica JP610]|uniref:A to I editase domain-containing protein n=2 Tax=Sphaeroforma arctica JP610 TaxID=667725 RepID=A0A0L0FIM9_9EUKA|nr:hypothetical protein, variant [Sphaeroforma arctica JP610]KNC75898.1 hypothetical protein, variant [Sphaeroforma arctica JP610]|eukprot:XP_014149800.1 hypothetical protein, variant [Sphaeroforma arctica JP610]